MERGQAFLFIAPKLLAVSCQSLDTDRFRAQPAAISVPFVLSLAIPVTRLSVPKLASAKPTTPGPVLNLTVSKSRAPFSSRPRMDIFPARPETCLTRFALSVAKRASIFRVIPRQNAV